MRLWRLLCQRVWSPVRPVMPTSRQSYHGLIYIFSAGRSWTAAELRRKSFKDLHTLWYVLLRERNLLASQRDEARRLDVTMNALRGGSRVHVVCSYHTFRVILSNFMFYTGSQIHGPYQGRS